MGIYRRDILAGLFGVSVLGVKPSFAGAEPVKARSARIIVALADNTNQGIVPTTKTLGNGQRARTNLYWGALYGVKTYFKRHADWSVGATAPSEDAHILDRISITPNAHPDILVVAEAWDGAYIEDALSHFYALLADPDNADDLIIFIGHNTLMDGPVQRPAITPELAARNRTQNKKAVILACKSAPYFDDALQSYGVTPYVMTRGLMAPEAYSLEAALIIWIEDGDAASARAAAAKAYAKYQKIPERNAKRLFGAE